MPVYAADKENALLALNEDKDKDKGEGGGGGKSAAWASTSARPAAGSSSSSSSASRGGDGDEDSGSGSSSHHHAAPSAPVMVRDTYCIINTPVYKLLVKIYQRHSLFICICIHILCISSVNALSIVQF